MSQAVAQSFNTLPDKIAQSFFLWMVPFLFIIVIIVVILFCLLIIEVRAIEYLRHQCFIDSCRAEKVLLLHKVVSSLLDCQQFLRNAWFVFSKSIDDLAAIYLRVDG